MLLSAFSTRYQKDKRGRYGKCMHAEIDPFKYIKVCKELFAIFEFTLFGSIVTFAIKY